MNNKDEEQKESENDGTEKIEIFSTEDEKIKSFGELLTNDSSRNILQILMKEELTALELSKKTELSLPLVIYHLNKMQDLNVIKISKVGTNVKGQDMKYYKATKFAVVILPSSVSEKAKESKSLLRSFNSIYRFAGIAIAGVAAWFSSISMMEPKFIAPPPLDISTPEDIDDSIRELSEADRDKAAMTSEEESALESEATPEPEPAPVPEPEPTAGFSSGEEAEHLEESLELTKRQLETQTTSDEFSGIIPEDFVIPIIITAAVIGIGLFLEFLYRRRISNAKKQQKHA